MIAIVYGGELEGFYNVQDLWEVATGSTPDWSEWREKGAMVPRKELDNQPKLPGYAGPMWDGDSLRYETHELNNILSR